MIVWLWAVDGNCAVQVALPVPALGPLGSGATGAAPHDTLGIQVPLDVKVKVPAGSTGPRLVGVIVAVKVTVWVATLGERDEVTVEVEPTGVTTYGRTGDVV